MVSSQENWLPETLAARNPVSETLREAKSPKIDMTENTSTTCMLSYTDNNYMTNTNTVSNLSLSEDVTKSQALLSTGIFSKQTLPQSIIRPTKYHQSYADHALWTGNSMTSTNANNRHNCDMGYHNINYYQPNAMFHSGYGENCSLRSLANPDFITGPWSNSMLWYDKQSNFYLNQYDLVSKEHLFPNIHTPIMQPCSPDEIHQTIPYHHLRYQPTFPSITCKLPLLPSSLPTTQPLPSIPVKGSISQTTTQPYIQTLMYGDSSINYSETPPQIFSQPSMQYTNYPTNSSTERPYPLSGSHEPNPTKLYQYSDICTNSNYRDKITDPELISANFEKDFAGGSGYTRITLGQGLNTRGLPYVSKEPFYSCLYVPQSETPRNYALGFAEKAEKPDSVSSETNENGLSELNQVDMGFDYYSKSSNQIEGSEKVSLATKTTTVSSKVTLPTILLDCECKVCGKILARKSTLKIHMRQHTGDRPFNCLTCGKSFAQAGLLQSHLRIHTGERPYTCSHCRKRFSHSSALKTHLRTHTGERPHKCPIAGCNLAFGDSSTLSKHRRTHTGERPYVCDICSKRFTQSGNMHKHRKSVHRAQCTTGGQKQKTETLEIERTPENSNEQPKKITCAG